MNSHLSFSLQLHYRFSSCTGEIEEERYINRYEIDIYAIPMDEDTGQELPPIQIGKARVLLFLWELCIENGYWSDELFSQMALQELGNLLFDHSTNYFHKDWESILGNSFSSNILYIDRIELLPEYRGKKYGCLIIKDIMYRMYGSFGIAVLKAFPLQLELQKPHKKEEIEWKEKMSLEEMEQDEKKATNKLYAFYRKIGFKRYKRSEYFYLNPYEHNPKFAKIDLNS